MLEHAHMTGFSPPGALVGMLSFLSRCMECRRGLAMRILSVRLSVRQRRAL